MKKIIAILAALVVLTLIGCASSGASTGESSGSGAAISGDPYSVDLDNLKAAIFSDSGNSLGAFTDGIKRNAEPFPKQWDGILFAFPKFPIDVTAYQRITIRCKYFNADGNEIEQGDWNAMVVLVYDVNGDLKGPEGGAGPNTPLKEFNLGGFSGQVSTDKGSRVRLSKAPGGVLFQASHASVKFIEITEVTFHN